MDRFYIDDILRDLASKCLREAGFLSTNKQAMEYLIEIFKEHLNQTAKILASNVNLAGRTEISFYDFIKCGKLLRTSIMSENIFQVLDTVGVDSKISFEQVAAKEEWVSPLANTSDKFIHIYDFMPEFPPTHTYRNTALPETRDHMESLNVKNRIEQSIKSEKNMFKLFKTSGSLPPFINYLYKMKEDGHNTCNK